MEKTIATIELDNGEGRAELFLRHSHIWCRRASDGEEWATEYEAMDDATAHQMIRQLWGANGSPWDLQWAE